MSNDKIPPSGFVTLAAETCELWQKQLATYAADPKAKAELARLMEPSRQVFAEWAKMLQGGGASFSSSSPATPAAAPDSESAATTVETPPAAAPNVHTADDTALRLAQLAHRVGELEKRIDQLETVFLSMARALCKQA